GHAGRPGCAGAGGVARTRCRRLAGGGSPRSSRLRRDRSPSRPACRYRAWRRVALAPVLTLQVTISAWVFSGRRIGQGAVRNVALAADNLISPDECTAGGGY